MSELINKREIVAMRAPMIDGTCVSQNRYAVVKGPTDLTAREFLTDSYTTAGILFNCNPPSQETYVDRRVMLRVPITITMTATGVPVGQKVFQTGFTGFRAYPLSSSMNAINITINSATFTGQPDKYIKEMAHYNNDRDTYNTDYSMTPTMLDNCQEYNDVYGTNINPLAVHTDNSYEVPRGGTVDFTVTTNETSANTANTYTAVVTATIEEPIFLPPFTSQLERVTGFYGIETMTAQFNFNQTALPFRMWAHNNVNFDLSSVSIAFGQPGLKFMYATPPVLSDYEPFGGGVYKHSKIEVRQMDYNSPVAANASAPITVQNYVFNSVPKRVYIFVKERENDMTINKTDSFFRIENIDITFENKTGILSSATPSQLYAISVKNGYKYPFSEWYGKVRYECIGGTEKYIPGRGSILCLQFPEDIGLRDGLSPGVSGKYNFYYNIRVKNMNQTRAVTPTVYTIVDTAGAVTIMQGKTFEQIGVVTESDVIRASSREGGLEYVPYEYYGGGPFWEKVKKFGAKAWEFLKRYGPVVAKVLLGLGKGGHIIPPAGKGGARVAGAIVAGNPTSRFNKFIKGGKKITRSEYASLMR